MSKYLIDEWPTVSFQPIEDIEIDSKPVRIFYSSFFQFLHFPETAVRGFVTFLLTDPDDIERKEIEQ